jgi:hypothetical protein
MTGLCLAAASVQLMTWFDTEHIPDSSDSRWQEQTSTAAILPEGREGPAAFLPQLAFSPNTTQHLHFSLSWLFLPTQHWH